jgi:hypothetical protein
VSVTWLELEKLEWSYDHMILRRMAKSDLPKRRLGHVVWTDQWDNFRCVDQNVKQSKKKIQVAKLQISKLNKNVFN